MAYADGCIFDTLPWTHEVERNDMGYDNYYSGTRYANMQGSVSQSN